MIKKKSLNTKNFIVDLCTPIQYAVYESILSPSYRSTDFAQIKIALMRVQFPFIWLLFVSYLKKNVEKKKCLLIYIKRSIYLFILNE